MVDVNGVTQFPFLVGRCGRDWLGVSEIGQEEQLVNQRRKQEYKCGCRFHFYIKVLHSNFTGIFISPRRNGQISGPLLLSTI